MKKKKQLLLSTLDTSSSKHNHVIFKVLSLCNSIFFGFSISNPMNEKFVTHQVYIPRCNFKKHPLP